MDDSATRQIIEEGPHAVSNARLARQVVVYELHPKLAPAPFIKAVSVYLEPESGPFLCRLPYPAWYVHVSRLESEAASNGLHSFVPKSASVTRSNHIQMVTAHRSGIAWPRLQTCAREAVLTGQQCGGPRWTRTPTSAVTHPVLRASRETTRVRRG